MIFPVSILSEDSNLFLYGHWQRPFLNSHSVHLIVGEALGPIRFCRNYNIICIQEFIWLQEGFKYMLETHWIIFPNPGSHSHKLLERYQINCKTNWVGISFFTPWLHETKLEMLSSFWRKIWPCCTCYISHKKFDHLPHYLVIQTTWNLCQLGQGPLGLMKAQHTLPLLPL